MEIYYKRPYDEWLMPKPDPRIRCHTLYRNNRWHIYWNWFARGCRHWGIRSLQYELLGRWRRALIIDWGWGELVIARESEKGEGDAAI